MIDAAERRQHLGPVLECVDRAVRAFEAADTGVRIQAEDEDIPEGLGAVELGNMTAVQDIEAAVGQNDPAARTPVRLHPQRKLEDILDHLLPG